MAGADPNKIDSDGLFVWWRRETKNHRDLRLVRSSYPSSWGSIMVELVGGYPMDSYLAAGGLGVSLGRIKWVPYFLR